MTSISSRYTNYLNSYYGNSSQSSSSTNANYNMAVSRYSLWSNWYKNTAITNYNTGYESGTSEDVQNSAFVKATLNLGVFNPENNSTTVVKTNEEKLKETQVADNFKSVNTDKTIFSQSERVYLNSIFGDKNSEKSIWNRFVSFSELADTNGDGKITEEEKDKAFLLLTTDENTKKAFVEKNKKEVSTTLRELRDVDKEKGKDDDMNLSVEEFAAKVGSGIANAVNVNGNKNNKDIDWHEFRAFKKMADTDEDGNITDKEYAAIKTKFEKGELKADTISEKVTAEKTRTQSLLKQRAEFYSDEFRGTDTAKLQEIYGTDGDFTEDDYTAFSKYADGNNDGFISPTERQAAMSKLEDNQGEQDILKNYREQVKNQTEFYNSLDTNNDGKVTQTELTKGMTAKLGSRSSKLAERFSKDFVATLKQNENNISKNAIMGLLNYSNPENKAKVNTNDLKDTVNAFMNTKSRDDKRDVRADVIRELWHMNDISKGNKVMMS